MRLTLLGGFRLEDGTAPVRLQPGGQRLVALLAVRGPLTRACAAGTLWPAGPRGHGMASLRTTLWRLGRLAEPPVTTSPTHVRLAAAVEVDLERLVAAASRLVEDGLAPEAGMHDLLRCSALELLPGCDEDWVLIERERLRELRRRALEALSEAERARRRYAIAVDAALAAIRLEPLRETAHRALISAYLDEQNVAEAARAYRTFRALLRSELDVEPSPALAELLAARDVEM